MKTLLFFVALAFAATAQAQFRLPSFDINKMVDTVKNVGKAVKEIDEPEEIAIGKDVASRLLGAAPLVADARLQRYVNHVGRWLAVQTERPDLPWQFGVLDSPNVNAFAVPGGTIFITRGLLERMRNEAELAGVLGHEIGHVIARHSSERLAKQQLTQGLLGALVVGSGDFTTAQIGQVVGSMINMSYGREDEIESDALGIRIMTEAGYDPRGMIRVMEVLAKASGGSRQPEFMSTHPAPENRSDRIREAIAKQYPGGVPENLKK
jgi:beta-barrel assembly-enhancing protease